MRPFIDTPVRLASALLVGALLVSGCSGSSDSQPASGGDVLNADGTNGTGGGAAGEMDDGATAGGTGETSGEIGGEGSDGNTTGNAQGNNTDVPDPLARTTIAVDFAITVPSYVSDSLQVRIVWGDEDIVAGWVGDEFWSASADFSSDTENLLVVTFYDGNGAIVLGRFEQSFKTGTNDSEAFTINADQFDTDQWDDDNDGVSNLDESIAGTDPSGSARVLLFSETRGYRHDSIEVALQALEELAASSDIHTTRADDSAGMFTDENLARFDAVVWVVTSGDVLEADEQTAFEAYIQSGGGYAGIHAASDTEYEWPWYGGLVGAWFERHPEVQSATQDVEDGTHPSTAHLSSRWTRTDEWYDYSANPRAQVTVLLSLDEDSYTGGGMGDDHPSAWYHEYDGGRSWYTGGGHTESSYAEPEFRAHLLGGLRYAAGLDE